MHDNHKKLITIVVPTFNEAENVEELAKRIFAQTDAIPAYDFRLLFIDNDSDDGTVALIKQLAEHESRIQLIVNLRNFGHIRSPSYGILQAQGDAVVVMAADLQDPPELLKSFVENWERGESVSLGVKISSRESYLFWLLRSIYYRILAMFSDTPIIQHATGFGMYDRRFVENFRRINESYPYFRGMVSQFGYKPALVEYEQPARVRGLSSNNFFSLFDMAMLGLLEHSTLPLRLVTFLGLIVSFLSLLAGAAYLVLKLSYWNQFPMGVAPLLISVFFFFGLQFLMLGLVGEYIAAIYRNQKNHPLVVEKERVNLAGNPGRQFSGLAKPES